MLLWKNTEQDSLNIQNKKQLAQVKWSLPILLYQNKSFQHECHLQYKQQNL